MGPSASEREGLAKLADVILPAWRDLPAPSSIGIAGRLLDRALAALPPAVLPALREILGGEIADPTEFVIDLKSRDPRLFAVLVLVAAAAYYLAPSVRERIGYHGQEALAIDEFELPRYLEDGTLERVIARGAFYRDLDERTGSAPSREVSASEV